MRLFRTVSLFACFTAAFAFAQGTRTWEQSKFEDLTKGTANGVAIRSVGALELAPTFKMLYTTPSTYLWSIASDGSGALYAAAGAPARVYRITPDGQSTTIFEPSELQVQALVVDKMERYTPARPPTGRFTRSNTTPRAHLRRQPKKAKIGSIPRGHPLSISIRRRSTYGISSSTIPAIFL